MNDYVQVVPKSGQEKEMFQLLLQLADHPRHVKVNTDGPGLTALVPQYLADKYRQSGKEEVTGQKRRGRPPGRKATRPAASEQQDDSTEGES